MDLFRSNRFFEGWRSYTDGTKTTTSLFERAVDRSAVTSDFSGFA
jgi:hypothetical protein